MPTEASRKKQETTQTANENAHDVGCKSDPNHQTERYEHNIQTNHWIKNVMPIEAT
jgi:hypothetical protein